MKIKNNHSVPSSFSCSEELLAATQYPFWDYNG